jgi:hypothetical protein
MGAKPSRFPFRWVLPMGQLLVCFVVLWPARVYIHQQLTSHVVSFRTKAIPAENGTSDDRRVQTTILGQASGRKITMFITVVPANNQPVPKLRLTIATDLNLPAALFHVPIAMMRSSRRPGTDPFAVTAITWPIVGMIFWWIAGRGIEALRNSYRNVIAPRISAPEILLAAIMLFVALFAWLMIRSGDVTAGEPDPFGDFVLKSAFSLWSLFSVILLIAGFTQRRIRCRPALPVTD